MSPERLVGVWFTVDQARALLSKTTLTAEEGKHLFFAHERIEAALRRLEPEPTYAEELEAGEQF